MVTTTSFQLLSVVCAALLGAQTSAPKSAVKPFPDVPPSHWAYQAVTELHERGILRGYPEKYDRSSPQATWNSLYEAIGHHDITAVRELTTRQLFEQPGRSSHHYLHFLGTFGGWDEPDGWKVNGKTVDIWNTPLGTRVSFRNKARIFSFVLVEGGWKCSDVERVPLSP